MRIQRGDPAKFWRKAEAAFLAWESRWSPARWRPWRDVFWGREGLYVLLRCGSLVGALVAVNMTDGGTLIGATFRGAAIALALLLLLDIVLVHASIAFVSRRPANLLRSAVLASFSFFQIPIGFAVFYLCSPRSFDPALTLDRALYFSVVTATTLGYGDVHPVAEARGVQWVVMSELVTSVGFLGVLLARLIALSTVPGQQGPGGLKSGQDRDP